MRSRRAARTVKLGLAMLFWAPIFALIYLRVGADPCALVLSIASVLMVVTLSSLHWGISVAATAHSVIAIVCLTLVALSALAGGSEAPAFRWLAVIPLLGFQLGGARTGVTWTAISLGFVLAIFGSQAYYGPFPSHLTPDTLKVVRMCSDVAIILCVAVVTAIFDRGESAVQRMLLEARHAAETATRAKSAFLANMSHEIRTPMNGIVGMANLSLRTNLTGSQRDYVQVIRSSAESLLRIVDDILDFSKIEAGRLTLDEIDFSLDACLRDSLLIIESQARTKGLEISCSIADSLPDRVCGDPFRVRQVLLNLLGNAVKFTDSGRIHLAATAVYRRQSACEIQFSVRDTGSGIPEDKLDAIFNPFVQADASTTRTHGGTGLGLAICAQLVELMGGRIWVESTVNEGSCFYFTLRLPPATTPAPAEDGESALRTTPNRLPPLPPRPPSAIVPPPSGDNSSEVAADQGADDSGRLRILVADDNPINRRVAQIVLSQLDYDVLTASDGEEAVAITQTQDVDLVLMDLSMPKLDGFAATRAIREREAGSGRRLPIVALTAHSLDEERERCQAAGMDGFLVKPLQPEAIARLIPELCGEPACA